MQFKYYLVAVLTVFLFYNCKQVEQNPRTNISLNSNWTFNYLPDQQIDKSLTNADFDDSLWPVIGIPHTWQTYETTGDLHPFIKNASERDDPYWWKGWGYYRKKFNVSELLKDKKIEIEFDGIQKYSRIYLNDQYIGDHKGGFTSFYFDLTPHVNFGKENTLVVVASNRRDDKYRIPPMNAGNWNVYGGIYRDVRLVIKNKVHIPYQGSYKHEGGTFIITPRVNAEQGELHVSTFVKNELETKEEITLISSFFDPDGKLIETIESIENIESGELKQINQQPSPVANPRLWHPETPNVYHLKSEVYLKGELVDVYESPFGFRWFHWDYEKNDLWLNGERIAIRGNNRHQEYPWIGDAIPKWLTKNDFVDMRENLGINFIRAAHYPNDPQVYNLTDKLGMVAVEEVPNIKSIDFDEEVQKHNVQEMIRRDRNHPSIFFWSVGNETSDAADSKWVIEEDTTRLIHSRKARGFGDFVNHDHDNLDMENLLRVTVKGYFDKGDAPEDRDFEPEDGQFCSFEEWQHEMAMIEGGSVRGSMKKNVVFWLYEDHGADREYKNSPLKHLNYKGWVDSYRFPKYIYYLTQALYTEAPMVFIHPHNWTPKYLGESKDFIVNSNCEKVELFVNDKKIDEAKPDAYNTVTFKNIEVKEGTLKVVGTSRDKTVENIVSMTGDPVKLSLISSHKTITAGKSEMAIVTADILDKEGNRVIHAKNTLHWSIDGQAALIGPELYESDFDKFESFEGTGYIRVPVSNIIRSANKSGKATVTVTSPGLESASIEIEVIQGKEENNLIIQPKLDDTERVKIVRNDNYRPSLQRIEEINQISGNQKFASKNKNELQEAFTSFIIKNNPEFDVSLEESKVFTEWFTEYLLKMEGDLIGDDFNYKADRYNDCRYISNAIDQSNLIFNLAVQLVAGYAKRMIVEGELVSAEEEAKLFTDLPRERMILEILDESDNPAPWISEKETRGTRECVANDFESLVELAYPAYKRYLPAKKNQYLKYVDAINPELVLKNRKFNLKAGDLFCLPDPDRVNYTDK